MRTIFYQGCEYKKGLNGLFFYKSTLGEWKKTSIQPRITKEWGEKQHKFMKQDGRLLALLKITGPLTALQITQMLDLSISGGKSFVGRLNALGLIERKGLFQGNSANGRSPVIWGLIDERLSQAA